jgi:predicted permease
MLNRVSLETLRSLGRDLAHAFRSLSKERAFTLVCVISLGIGIGAFVALVTFNRAIKAPARVINTEGLAEILVLPNGPLRAKAGVWAVERWSYPDYQTLRQATTGMEVAGWTMESAEFGEPTPDEKTPPRVPTMYVSSNYFRVFGVPLARGSGFDPALDDSPAAEAHVVVSHDFWQSRLSADPAVIGKPITIDGVPHTVVGVTPPEFRGHFHFFQAPGALLFVPLERHPRLIKNATLRDDRSIDWVRMHGRLQPGTDLTHAKALVATTMASLSKQYPATNEFKAATVEPYVSLGAADRPESMRVFGVLLSLAAAVLLIVCLNISGMMLVRGTTRERELSIRAALGADRRTLIQHLFFEAVLLAFVAGGLSAFVLFGIPALVGWRMGVPVPQEIDFDATGVAISTSLCFLVSVLFGMLPALRFSRPSLLPALKDDAGGGGSKTIRVHRIAAMVQIGIAVPFLVISGVMIDRVRTADFGFPTDGLAGARVPAIDGKQREAGAIRNARESLKQVSGVRSVAIADGMPIDFDYREYRVASLSKAQYATAHVTRVGEDFLETVGAPLVKGRTITAGDLIAAAPVAVISDPLARQLFAGSEPIGEHVKVSFPDGSEEEFTIVGVTADFASSQLTTIREQILLPLPDTLPPNVQLIVRGAPGDEPRLRSALETALRELGVQPVRWEGELPGIATGADMVEKSLGDLVSEGTAVGFVGGLVLILAALGIVGVVGFMVATRTREFAVRMALGSTRGRVFGLMLSDTVKLVIPGVVGGLLIGAVLIRTMPDVMGTPLMMGPNPLGMMEPVIYAAASLIAIAVAVLAGLPAARRATTVEPMVAIRSE